MDGGGFAFAPGKPSDLPNLSIVKEVEHLPYFLGAAILVNVLSIALARGYQVGGKTLNDWYDSFGYEAITVDLAGLLLLFITGQAIYTQYVTPVYGWNPLYFVIILVILQVLYDLALYYGVINTVPKGQNEIIDLFKRYAEENGTTALARDALLMIGSVLCAFGLLSVPTEAATFLSLIAVYALPYVLNLKMMEKKKAPVEQPKKNDEKKEQPLMGQRNSWDPPVPQIQSNKPWL
jgi:hypothetical protein